MSSTAYNCTHKSYDVNQDHASSRDWCLVRRHISVAPNHPPDIRGLPNTVILAHQLRLYCPPDLPPSFCICQSSHFFQARRTGTTWTSSWATSAHKTGVDERERTRPARAPRRSFVICLELLLWDRTKTLDSFSEFLDVKR